MEEEKKKLPFLFVFSTYLPLFLLKFRLGELVGRRIKFYIQWALSIEIWVTKQGNMFFFVMSFSYVYWFHYDNVFYIFVTGWWLGKGPNCGSDDVVPKEVSIPNCNFWNQTWSICFFIMMFSSIYLFHFSNVLYIFVVGYWSNIWSSTREISRYWCGWDHVWW